VFFLPGRGSLSERLVAFALWWALVAATVWAAAYLVAGIHVDGWQSLAAVALIVGLLNVLVRPVLFTLTFPATILTLGAWRVVAGALVNAVLLWVADRVASGYPQLHYRLDHFLWDAILGGVIISGVGWVLGMLLDPRRAARRMVR
jgi:putative membrane protein